MTCKLPPPEKGMTRYIISFNGTELDFRDAETSEEALKDFKRSADFEVTEQEE